MIAGPSIYPYGADGAVAAGDVNGDGRPDLAVVNNWGSVNVLINTYLP
jgi:hypothetical protein